MAWAKVVPATVRNPLFHWSHMELKNPFGIEEYLNEDSAKEIYQHCNQLLAKDDFSTQGLLKKFNVKMVGTTDDPSDSLEHHKALISSGFEVKVKPSFRPDKSLMITDDIKSYRDYIKKLGAFANIEITDVDSLIAALRNRIEFFAAHGASISDHGLNTIPTKLTLTDAQKLEYVKLLKGDFDTFSDTDAL